MDTAPTMMVLILVVHLLICPLKIHQIAFSINTVLGTLNSENIRM